MVQSWEKFFQIKRRFAYIAIYYAIYPGHYLHKAILYHMEGKCDRMEICFTPQFHMVGNVESNHLAQIDQL